MDPSVINKQKIKKFKSANIYGFGINPLVDLQKFKIIIDKKGLDLHLVGKQSVISFDAYQKLKK